MTNPNGIQLCRHLKWTYKIRSHLWTPQTHYKTTKPVWRCKSSKSSNNDIDGESGPYPCVIVTNLHSQRRSTSPNKKNMNILTYLKLCLGTKYLVNPMYIKHSWLETTLFQQETRRSIHDGLFTCVLLITGRICVMVESPHLQCPSFHDAYIKFSVVVSISHSLGHTGIYCPE